MPKATPRVSIQSAKMGRKRLALADCLKLYRNTILQLNNALDSSTKCTLFDIQAWLSTALTNLETCRTGLAELNVSDYVLPLITSNNVTKLISNSLAINNASAGLGKETYCSHQQSRTLRWLRTGRVTRR